MGVTVNKPNPKRAKASAPVPTARLLDNYPEITDSIDDAPPFEPSNMLPSTPGVPYGQQFVHQAYYAAASNNRYNAQEFTSSFNIGIASGSTAIAAGKFNLFLPFSPSLISFTVRLRDTNHRHKLLLNGHKPGGLGINAGRCSEEWV
jgi:hypothetical protein